MKVNLPKLNFQLSAMLFLIFATSYAFAQTSRKADVILLRDETKLEVFIHEVEEQAIKYRKLSDPDGPLFSVKKADIVSIHYGNGEVETFEATLDVTNYYAPNKQAKPAQSTATRAAAAPGTKNKFLEELRTSTPDHLRATYKYYKSRSKAGLIMGIAGTSVGTIVAAIGTGLVVGATDDYGNYATYQDQQRAQTGAIMMLGGFASAVTFGTVGFVKAGKNGSKASRIRRELLKRNEPVTFNLSPGFNALNGTGYLTLKINL